MCALSKEEPGRGEWDTDRHCAGDTLIAHTYNIQPVAGRGAAPGRTPHPRGSGGRTGTGRWASPPSHEGEAFGGGGGGAPSVGWPGLLRARLANGAHQAAAPPKRVPRAGETRLAGRGRRETPAWPSQQAVAGHGGTCGDTRLLFSKAALAGHCFRAAFPARRRLLTLSPACSKNNF